MSLPTSADVYELTKCGMCHGVTNNPMVLNCQHVFCCNCLQEWNQGGSNDPSSYRGGQTMMCPICRRLTPLPDARREIPLPLDFHTMHTLPELVTVREPEPPPQPAKTYYHCVVCSDDSAQFKAACYCQSCQDYMCESCGDTHQNTAIFSGHEVFSLVEKKENGCKWNTCKKHPTKMQDYYCELCLMPVCSACVTGQHRDHPVSNISQSIDASSRNVKQLLMKLESQDLQEPLSPGRGELLCQELVKAIGTSTEETEAKIKEHTQGIFQDIQRQENEMLRNLHAYQDSLVGILTGQRQQDFYELLQECQAHLNPLEVLKGYRLLSGEIELALKSPPKSCLEILAGLAFSYDFSAGEAVSVGHLTQGFLKNKGHSVSQSNPSSADLIETLPNGVRVRRKSVSFHGLPTIPEPPPIPPRQRSTSLKFNRRPVPPCPPVILPNDLTASVSSTHV